MEELTIYATSNASSVFEFPGQVSVVGRDSVEMLLPSSVADLLRDVPGLEFSGGPRRTGQTPSIRGRGGENVLVLFDGARQSFISAHDGRFYLDPELVSSAEVVKGPASALYGSGAVGGVLAIETLDASDLLKDDETAGLRLRLAYQDVNEEASGALTGYYRESDLDVLANITLRHSQDIDLGSGDTLPSQDQIASGLLKGEYQILPALALSGAWLHFDNTAEEPNNGQGISVGGGSDLDADVEKDIVTDTYRIGMQFNPQNNDLLDTNLTLYRTETEVGESELASTRSTLRNIETKGLSVRNASRFEVGDTDHTLTVGGDWYLDEQSGRDSASDDGTRGGVPDGKSSFAGVFVQLESTLESPLGLPGDLLVIPGVRYDEFDSEAAGISPDKNKDEALSPRLGLSYGPVNWFRLFANYAEAFRAPSINELYLDGTHFNLPHPVLGERGVFVANRFVPNARLTAEDSETLEVGFGVTSNGLLQADDTLSMKASYYESDVQDLIDITVDVDFSGSCFSPPFTPCGAGTSTSENVAAAELEGVELEASYDSDHFMTRLSYSRIEGRDTTDGSDLGVITPDRINLDLRWKLPLHQAAVGTRIQLADSLKRRDVNSQSGELELIEERDGYFVWDLYSTWQTDFLPGFRFDVSVENITDEDYERVFAGVSEPGRNVKLAVTWQKNH